MYEDREGFGIDRPIHLPLGEQLSPFVVGEFASEFAVSRERMIHAVFLVDQLASWLNRGQVVSEGDEAW